MEDPQAIRDYLLKLDGRRLDSVAATEAARDLRALAWREMVLRPLERGLIALWRGLIARAALRAHSDGAAP